MEKIDTDYKRRSGHTIGTKTFHTEFWKLSVYLKNVNNNIVQKSQGAWQYNSSVTIINYGENLKYS